MKNKHKILAIALSAALVLSGCSASAQNSDTGSSSQNASTNTEASIIQVDTSSYDLEYSKKDENDSYEESSAGKVTFGDNTTASGDGVSANGNAVTISKAGTYVVSGSCSDGQLIVNAGDDDKVQIVLSGLDLTCNSGPCINIQNSDKVFVTLVQGSSNTLSDGSEFSVSDDDELDSTIYSKSDLSFNGSGTLKINATAGHAIHSKDDLVITGGVYEINSTKAGIVGKDSVKIKDGTFNITSKTDCIKSTNSDDDGRGYVSIDGGTFTLKSTDKGIQATKLIRLAGGNLTIESENDTIHSNSLALLCGANLSLSAGDDAVHANDQLEINAGKISVSKCYEGLEAYEITVSGGEIEIHASDDGVNAAQSNSSSDVTEDTNGDVPQNIGDTNNNNSNTNSQTPPAKAEGDSQQNTNNDQSQQQGQAPSKPNGNSDSSNQGQMTPPSGDMQKPEGENDPRAQRENGAQNGQRNQGDVGGQPGGGTNAGPGTNQGASIAITGGTLTVYASNGDCLDANGSILMTAGTVTLVGPSNNGNSSLDFDGTGKITGGTFFAIGSSGMAQNFGSTSTQASVATNATGKSGDVVSVTDSSGNTIVSFTTNCDYSYVQASASSITEGQTYKILANGSELASANATTQQSSGISPQGGGAGGGGDRQANNQRGENTQSSTLSLNNSDVQTT